MATLTEQSALIRSRAALSIDVDGVAYIPTTQAACELGVTPDRLRQVARAGDGNAVVQGRAVQYVIRPRHRGDERAPIYWRIA